jgi:hypothetical protein
MWTTQALCSGGQFATCGGKVIAGDWGLYVHEFKWTVRGVSSIPDFANIRPDNEWGTNVSVMTHACDEWPQNLWPEYCPVGCTWTEIGPFREDCDPGMLPCQ